MDYLWFELPVVLLLILANGFFAGAELAIVSVRHGRIAHLAEEGSRRARVVARLQDDPHRFLATVQIGVTLVGTMASAIGGAAAIDVLKPLLQQAPVAAIADAAEPLALMLVVGILAFLSLVIGELVPKALALVYAEKIALAVARPISFLARVAGPAVFVLTLSSRTLLALFGIRGEPGRTFITREEIGHLVAEGRDVGAVTPREQELIQNVFDFSRTRAREIMIPRTRIVGLDLNRSREELLQLVLRHPYSRYPVFRDNPDEVVGYLLAKDFLGSALTSPAFAPEDLVRPMTFVPESKRVPELLRDMQRTHTHLVVVVDEYGGMSGILTIEDLLEELIGEIEDEYDQAEPPRIVRLAEGSYEVDGLLPIHDLADLLGVRFPPERPYDTLSGLILAELGRIPAAGEQLRWGAFLLTCTQVTRATIRRVRIAPVVPPPVEPS